MHSHWGGGGGGGGGGGKPKQKRPKALASDLQARELMAPDVHFKYVYNKGHNNADSLTVQELRESRGGRPGLSVLTSLLVSVDIKLY